MNSSSQVEHEYTTPGIYTACITVADACEELCTQCVTIGTLGMPILDAIVTDGGCDDSLGSIELLVSGLEAPLEIVWDTGESTGLIQNLESGTYNVTVTGLNNNILEGTYDIEVFESVICRPVRIEANPSVENGVIFTQNIELSLIHI